MRQTANSRRLRTRTWLIAAALLVVPGSLAAETADSSPFDDFPQLEGFDGDTEPLVDTDQPPEIEVPDGDVSPPDEPIELRLNVEETTSWEVASRMQLSYSDRPDFEPDYRSGMTLQYRPISETRRRQLPATQLGGDQAGPTDAPPVMATVTDYSALFEHPAGLREPTRTHAPLRDARFSFRLDDRGNTADLRLHPPTHPLVRSGAEEMLQLETATGPTLPKQPVGPGETWTDSASIERSADSVEITQEIDIQYRFVDWTSCGRTYCALLDVEYDFEAAGVREVVHLRTDSDAAGTTRGRLLFDPEAGRTVASSWTTTVDGHTTAIRPDDPDDPVHDFDFDLRVETSMQLIED